jgi:hypothetical protein
MMGHLASRQLSRSDIFLTSKLTYMTDYSEVCRLFEKYPFETWTIGLTSLATARRHGLARQ